MTEKDDEIGSLTYRLARAQRQLDMMMEGKEVGAALGSGGQREKENAAPNAGYSHHHLRTATNGGAYM